MSDSFCTANDTEVKLTSPSSLEPTTPPFHTIPHFPTKLIPSLIESHQGNLAQVAAFHVTSVTLKIGKQVNIWPLLGADG